MLNSNSEIIDSPDPFGDQKPSAPVPQPSTEIANSPDPFANTPAPKPVKETKADVLRRLGKEEGVDSVVPLLGIGRQELGDSMKSTVSGAGAIGGMQVLPATGLRYVTKEEWETPEGKMRAGVRYYKDLLKQFNGNESQAIAGYFTGQGNVNKAIKGGANLPNTLDPISNLRTPGYVNQVQQKIDQNTPDEIKASPDPFGDIADDVKNSPDPFAHSGPVVNVGAPGRPVTASALPPTAPAPAGPHFNAQNPINPMAAVNRLQQGTAAQIQRGLQNPPQVDPAYTSALTKAATDKAAMMQEYNEKVQRLNDVGGQDDPSLRTDVEALRKQIQMSPAQTVAQQQQFEQLGKDRALAFSTALDRVKNDPKHKEQAIIELGRYGPVSPEEAAQLGISQSYIHNAMMSVAKSGTEFLGSVARAAKRIPQLEGISSQNPDKNIYGQAESTLQDADRQLQAQRNVYGKEGIVGNVVSGGFEMLPDLLIAGVTGGESLPAQAAKFGAITGAKAFGRGEDPEGVIKATAFGAGGVLTGHLIGMIAPEFAESVLGQMGVRGTGNAILGGLWTAADGGDTKAIASSAILFGAQGLFGGGHPEKAADLLRSSDLQEAVLEHAKNPSAETFDNVAKTAEKAGLDAYEAQKFATNVDSLKSASVAKPEAAPAAQESTTTPVKTGEKFDFRGLDLFTEKMPDGQIQVRDAPSLKASGRVNVFTPQQFKQTFGRSIEDAPESSPIGRDEQGRVVRKFGAIPEHPIGEVKPGELTGTEQVKPEDLQRAASVVTPNNEQSTGQTAEPYVAGQKYHQPIPEITHLPPDLLMPRDSGEVSKVSDQTASEMKFDEPVKVSLFSDGTLQVQDGHHRVAAAKQLGREGIPVEIQGINARGERINELLATSKELAARPQPDNPTVGFRVGADLQEDGKTYQITNVDDRVVIAKDTEGNFKVFDRKELKKQSEVKPNEQTTQPVQPAPPDFDHEVKTVSDALNDEKHPLAQAVERVANGDTSPEAIDGIRAAGKGLDSATIDDTIDGATRIANKQPTESATPRSSETPPAETGVGESGQAVGIKNKITDAELEAQGKPKIDTSAQKRGFDEVIDNGKKLVDNGQIDPAKLADKIANGKPHALDAEETAALLYHKTRLLNQEDSIMKELRGHRETGDIDAEIDARGRLQAVQEQLDTARKASRKSGYEQGLGLAIRRAMMERDYSLSRLTDRWEAAQGGKPLTAADKIDVQKLRDSILKREEQAADYDERQSKGEASKTITELRKEASAERKAGRTVKRSTLDGEFASQKNALAKLFSRDPKGPGKGLGGREAGAVDPELLGLPVEALKILRDMARNRLEAGLTTVDGVVDSIHEAVADVMGGVTKRQIRDLISGYGKTSKPNPEALAVAMRELTAGMRDVSAEEDILGGKAPERSGYQRGPMTPEARARRQRINQLMREHGIEIERSGRSSEEQQKSALDAVKTRLKNGIEDLNKLLETGEKRPARKGLALDEEAKGLKARRDELQKQYDQMHAAPKNSPEEQAAIARKAGLRKQIDALDARLAGNETPQQAKIRTAYDDETVALQAERDMLKRQLENPAAKNKEAVQNRLDEAERKLREKDLSRKEAPYPSTIYDDAETTAMRDKLQEANRQIAEQRALPEKIKGLESKVADAQRKIDENDLSRPAKGEAAGRPEPPEVTDLRGKLKDLNKQLTDARGQAKQVTDLQDRVADLQRRIRERDFSKQPQTVKDVPPEVQRLRDQRDSLRRDLQDLEGPKQMTDQQRMDLAKRSTQKAIDEYQRRIDQKDFATKQASNVSDPELDALKAKRDALKTDYQKLADADPAVQAKRDAAKLDQLKTRMQKRLDSLKQQTATGNFYRNAQGKLTTSKPRVPFAGLDPEAQEIKANVEKAQSAADAKIKAIEMANRSAPEKIMDFAAKIRRFIVLSGATAAEKLTMAGVWRQVLDPVEAGTGGAISKTPGLRDIAAKAPREGAFKPSVEAQASALYIKKMLDLSRFKETLKTGKGKLDLIHGGKEYFDSDSKTDRILGFYNRLHATLKEPVKEAEFFRSTQYRTDQAIKSGLDIADAKVRDSIAAQAYLDANRKVFMNPNFVTDAYQKGIRSLETYEGKGAGAAKATALLGKIFFPVVRVPTNYLFEVSSYSPAGFAKAAPDLYKAVRHGVDSLSAEDADYVMRNLKKGLIGSAMMGMGAALSNNMGGFYTQGNYSTPEDMKAGEVKIAGINIPRLFLHHPLIEAMQFGATWVHLHGKQESLARSFAGTSMALAEEQPFIGETLRNADALREKGKFEPASGQFIGGLVTPPDLRRIANILDPKTPTSVMMKLLQTGGLQSADPMYRPPKTFAQGFESGIPSFIPYVNRKNIPSKLIPPSKPVRPEKPAR